MGVIVPSQKIKCVQVFPSLTGYNTLVSVKEFSGPEIKEFSGLETRRGSLQFFYIALMLSKLSSIQVNVFVLTRENA